MVGVNSKLKVSGQHEAVVVCLMTPSKPTGHCQAHRHIPTVM